MNEVFINEAFTKALNDYQDNKDSQNGIVFNSFLTVVIRLLVCIYSELDLVNPFVTESESALISNLTKFGYSKENVDNFFANIQSFYDIDRENSSLMIKKENPFFVEIQKQIIDMLVCKKMNFHITNKDTEAFFELLYTEKTVDPLRLSFNYLTAKDVSEVEKYFQKEMAENIPAVETPEKTILNARGYEVLGYDLTTIKSMSKEELDKINHQVYDYFKIRENAINKEYLLEKAIENYDKENNKVTSGNGYVDILLIMGAICTAIMVLSIVTFMIL